MSTHINQFTVNLLERNNLSEQVYNIITNKPNRFNFTAGQYIQFFVPEENKLTPKSFSLVSTPGQGYLEFCIKHYPNGLAANYFYNLDIGSQIKFRGPLGRFTPEYASNKHNFIATGVGIAPILCMITNLLEEKTNNYSISLLFGLRFQENILYKKRLTDLADKYDNFSFTFTLTQPNKKWNSLTGRVTKHLDNFSKGEFYICGNREMVQDVNQQLQNKDITPSKIHFEIF